MDYLIAGLVIAIGITLMISGVEGTGSDLFTSITGKAPSGNSQSGKATAAAAASNATGTANINNASTTHAATGTLV